MLVLPIPLITSLALGFLFLRSAVRGDRSWWFSALIAACAAQGVVVSLVQHYGVASLRFLQPVMATLIPPLAWSTFQATAVRTFDPRRDLAHLAGPAVTTFCVAFAPGALDLVVPGLFLGYGAAILVALRSGADGLPLARLETGERPRLIWGVIAGALIASALSDGLIALAIVAGAGWLQPWIISVFTSLSLALVGALCLSQSLVGGAEAVDLSAPVPNAADMQRDAEIMERLNGLMTGESLYLNADLTLDRLSKRLRVPAKALSTTINRATGGNVSRYVNAFRIRHACERLRAGDNITSAMLDSGFNTKSNFNREFLRVEGCPPSVWLARHDT